MPGKFIRTLGLIVTMSACAPNPQPTPSPYYTPYTIIPASTNPRAAMTNTALTPTSPHAGPANLLVVPTNEPPYPTNTPFISSGEIYPTPTFASTFTPLPPLRAGENVPLTSIHMMDETSGWGIEAGGWRYPNGGHILHTKDGAATWEDVTPQQGSYLDAGFFALDANTAWASPFGQNNRCIKEGEYIYCRQTQTYVWVTHNGGQTWNPSQPICIDASCDDYGASNSEWILPHSIRFLDADNGWLLLSINFYMFQDRYKVYRTQDGGSTWKFVTSSWLDDTLTGGATSVEPLDLDHVLFMTNELYGAKDIHNALTYYTSNTGGGSWEYVNVHLPSNPIGDPIWDELSCGNEKVTSIPPLVVDINEYCYTLNKKYERIPYSVHFHSMDGAKTWLYWQQTGDVQFINAKTGWRLMRNDDSTFALEKTSDGGTTWTRINIVDWEGQLSFVNERTGWALIHQGDLVSVIRTTDGGRTWEIMTQAQATPMPTP